MFVVIVLWFLMTVINDLAALKLKDPILLKNEYSKHNTILKRQIIVWSRVRSGSSFFLQLLRGKNFFYSPEPIATLWPNFWEHTSSTTQTVNASTIGRFLQDALLCKFEEYPEYVKNFYLLKWHNVNPLMATFCDDQKIEFCSSLELIYTLCKSAKVHVTKLVRVHLRNLLYILRQQADHQGLLLKYERYYSTPDFKHHVLYNTNSLHKNAPKSKKRGTEIENQLNKSSKHQFSVTENTQKQLISKEFTRSFLKNEELMNMKIIHLVRDPRGTINSRRRNRWIPPDEKNSHSLCNDLNDELKYALELQKLFPHKYRLIRYEWLVLNIEKTTRELYNWLGIPYTIHSAHFIASHTLGLETGVVAIHPFSIFRNSSSNAFKWRELLLGRNFFYSFEPVATFWPSFWEHTNSETQTMNASTIVRFLQDILHCKFEKYPEYVKHFYLKRRYRLILYEWLVLDIEKTSRELYNWLGIPYTIHVGHFIASHTLRFETNSTALDPFDTFRNSSSNAFKWREMLEFEEMQKIQNDCKDVLRLLGYRIYHNQEHYHDPTLTPLLNTSFFDY
ncbi:hypothetical protein SK128_006570 [Halocaridina rubra]|uniref:Uncharacterized protein n=1 Tax=Halocaridina rubra TaxID=373956 RepID=A0AAN8ZXK7_HALRR